MTLSAGESAIDFVGCSVGGGLIEITEVQGYTVQFSGEYETLLIQAVDQPGTINTITGQLSEHQINVAFLRVERDERGGSAMMIIEVDHHIEEEYLSGLRKLEWVRWIRKLPRLKD